MIRRVLLLTAWVAGLVAPSAQARPDLQDCIAGAERFERRYEHVAATTETCAYTLRAFDEGDGSIPPDRLARTGAIKFWRDGRTARSLERTTYRGISRGRVNERVESIECLVRPGDFSVMVSRDPATEQFEGPNLTAQSPDAAMDPLLQLLSRVGPFVFTARIDHLGSGLAERLKSARSTVKEVRLNGRAAVRLDFADAWGEQSVWLDPGYDYHPVHVTERKRPRHWVRPNVRLDQVPEKPDIGPITGIEVEVIVTGLRQVRGAWFADGFEERRKLTASDSKQHETKNVTRITEISPDPRSGGNLFRVTTPVPDGTWVTIDNKTNIRYEWRDGKVVKPVD